MNKYLLIVLIALICFACDSTSPDEAIDYLPGMIPMKVGFYWTYNVSGYDSNGVVTQNNLWQVSIIRDTMINNEKWYLFRESEPGTEYYFDANWHTNRNNVTYYLAGSNPQVVYPVEINSVDSNYSINRHRLVSKNEEVVVPYGVYTAYLYLIGSTENEYYVALNKGQLKHINYLKRVDGSKYVFMISQLVDTNVF